MSEHFEKTYISVNEFVSSWEKEIYELNNLDYFTFLLINHIGYAIEHDFFSKDNNSAHLQIDPEEIATLSFNIGDSFESFLENNCFGDCSLSCPTRLNELVNPQEKELNATHINIMQIMSGCDLTKKQFLLTDILNYVVLDTLFDFYNYEIGLDLDDADIGLMQLADFITAMLEKFIEHQGQPLLMTPKEPAHDLFQNMMSESEDDWEDLSASSLEDEEDGEEWKNGNQTTVQIIEEYLAQATQLKTVDKKLLNYFLIYTDKYAGITQIDEFAGEDIEEFFLFWLLRELSLEPEIKIKQIESTFEQFFTWLDLSQNLEIKKLFSDFMSENYQAINRAMHAIHSYFRENSFVGGILEANGDDSQIVDGFFLVESINHNGFLKLRDIYYQQTYLNVQVKIADIHLLTDTILDANLKYTSYGCRVIHLEYVFPKKAKPFLH